MDNLILKDCIDSISENKSAGYSYVQSFADTLWKYRENLNIEKYYIIWRVQFNDNYIKDFHYSSNNYFDLSKFDLNTLMCQSNFSTIESSPSVIALPINENANNPAFFNVRGLILLFFRNNKVTISEDKLTLFHILLNKKSPMVLCEDAIKRNMQIMCNFENLNCDKFAGCLGMVGNMLENVPNNAIETDVNCGLMHFSLWNWTNSQIKMKQFSRNIFSEYAHCNSHTSLNDTENHFVNKAIESYQESDHPQILKCFSYNEVRDSFIDENYFINIGLNENNATIIVTTNGKFASGFPDRILNFYIANIVYTPFISKIFITTLTQNITNLINKSLTYCRDQVITTLINESMMNPNELQFYTHVKSTIKDVNEADDVLIYLKEESFRQKPNKDTLKQDNNVILPDIYTNDKFFVEWLNLAIKGHASNYYVNRSANCIVSSSLLLRTRNEQQNKECIIILINEKHQPSKSCVYYNNVFNQDNYYITEKCGPFLIHYQNMQDSINNKNYLLHKLRHEIPSCTDAINNGLNDIRDALDRDIIPKNHIQTISQNIALNNSRILVLAKFFSTVDFDNSQFAKDKITVNIRTFLNSYIETFREEGKYRGVDIYYQFMGCDEIIIEVSNYFQLALVNVITNAVRYASNGTCVFIGIYLDKIEIRNIGIGIAPNEVAHIFKEGYRGNEAKRINEKGMGYGLFLTRKVLDAHNMEIEVDSQLYYPQNYFAQNAVYRYLSCISKEDKENFIYNELDDINKDYATKLYERISANSGIIESSNPYGNLKLETIKFWLNYIGKYHTVFYDMEDIFDEPIYEVIFTIYFK